jgi:putative CRISPR-associated protein (TIGR02619 family)
MRTFITTVGTSLLNNAKKALGKEPTLDDLVRYLRADLRNGSAEMNVLDRVGLEKEDRVVFLHSATQEGRLAADALTRVASDFSQAESKEIENLGYDSAMFRRGLRSFNEMLVSEIRDARRLGSEPKVNANGGFKALIAQAVALCTVLKVPVLYIHDQFSELVEMPPLPLDWDLRLAAEADFVLEKLYDGLSWSEFQNLLAGFEPPDREALKSMAEELEGEWILGDVGLVLLEALRGVMEQPPDSTLQISSKARDKWSKVRGTSEADTLLKRFRQLARGPIRRAVKHSSDCLFYPSGGQSPYRIMFVEEEGQIRILDFWTNHDDYVRDLNAGRAVRKEHGNEFHPFEEPV